MLIASESIDKAKEIIASVKGKNYSLLQLKDLSIELAGLLLRESQNIQMPNEKAQQVEIARMMEEPTGKLFAFSLTDQCFRSHSSSRTADQIVYLIKTLGIPKFPPASKRMGLRLFKWFGRWFPSMFVPFTKQMLRQETAKVILPGEAKALSKHMLKRRREGVRINLNHLGEAILGEEDATRRFTTYLDDLAKPEVEYISIKISTIYSQIYPLAWDDTIEQLSERLRELYRTAKSHMYVHPDGRKSPKFINLDMEEYRDLGLTVELFCKVLSEPEFLDYSAGIVLQAYLPDAFAMQQRITDWACQRVAQGGAPVKIRVVKGANLAMEQVEASIKGWPQATYTTKLETDANFKQMLLYGCHPLHAKAVHIGIGSHNLFDIALGLLLRSQYNVEEDVNFEMLEGMADNICRTILMVAGEVLLYCPVATDDEFQHAVAYLIRRLDENTAPENFLRHLFGMKLGGKEWQNQAALFSQACEKVSSLANTPRRQQNRLTSPTHPAQFAAFDNEPDTDWSLSQNIEWGKKILNDWQERQEMVIPLVINGKLIAPGDNFGSGFDPSRPFLRIYRYALATPGNVEEALNCAKEAQQAWQATSPAERSKLLEKIAQLLRERRGDLIGAMVSDAGKILPEADVEVSEAIDFAEYYRRNIEEIAFLEDISWKPKGTVLVAPPWNFPCSIPMGGVVAALATGNTVILKPPTATARLGWMLAEICWEAGVDKKVLQFITCEDEPVGSLLIKDPRIDVVLLTGATETAKLMLNMRPDLDLIAETGGKNSIIVTSMADRDLAIKDIITSAFGHSGQKCSACSLAILEADVYDDQQFLQQLRDAVKSLRVGSAWEITTKVNPLITVPTGSLKRGLTELEAGTEWLLKPVQDEKNPQLWSPGIILGVKEGGFIHQTELFGPVLGLMRADNFTHALKLANGTPYGLTAGLQSLDPREQLRWQTEIEAGNCYINRSITGAIVQRQPFGGCKDSSFGRGAKVGGPNFLMQMMHASDNGLPKDKGKIPDLLIALSPILEKGLLNTDQFQLWQASIGSYAFFWNGYFSKDHDLSRIVGQDNFLRYLPHKGLVLRINSNDNSLDLLRAAAAASIVGCHLEISAPTRLLQRFKDLPWPKSMENISWKSESNDDLLARIAKGEIKRLRFVGKPPTKLLEDASKAGCRIQISPVVGNGRVELLNYLREISISTDYHRYGNLGDREHEKRRKAQ